MFRQIKIEKIDFADIPIPPTQLAHLIRLIDKGTISGTIAKKVFHEIWRSNETPDAVIKKHNWALLTDSSAIESIVDEVLASHPDLVEEFRGGQEKVFGFFVGQVMKQTKGQANPANVNKLLREKLGDSK